MHLKQLQDELKALKDAPAPGARADLVDDDRRGEGADPRTSPRSRCGTSSPAASASWRRRPRREAKRRARNLVADALQRVAASAAAETTVTLVELPSDDMKGRIIGREGRNIRTLEHLTGVDFIIDDTPNAVVLSSFDGIRREIARMTLLKLIEDGRIHPTRIEEMYYLSKAELDEHIRQAGEQAVFEANCGEFHEELVKILGRLRYRTSYGQNVLKHTLEVVSARGDHGRRGRGVGQDREARRAAARPRQGDDARGRGLARADLDAARAPLRREAGRLPRDRGAPLRGAAADGRGRAADRRRRDLGRRGPARAARASSTTSSGSSRSSSSRPPIPGVEKVYALQAGREIRVIVKPAEIDDDAAVLLSHEIAREIEDHLEYPGQIKVTVIRESRAIDVAANKTAAERQRLDASASRRRCCLAVAFGPCRPKT